jgi:hypothetical protein
METIDTCTGEEWWWSESSAIFADCVYTVSSIGSVAFIHCLSQADQVTHEIARFYFSNNSV